MADTQAGMKRMKDLYEARALLLAKAEQFDLKATATRQTVKEIDAQIRSIRRSLVVAGVDISGLEKPCALSAKVWHRMADKLVADKALALGHLHQALLDQGYAVQYNAVAQLASRRVRTKVWERDEHGRYCPEDSTSL